MDQGADRGRLSPEQAAEAVVKAIELGNVRCAHPEALENMDFSKPLEIVSTKIRCWGPHGTYQGGFEIEWVSRYSGFGALTFCIDKDGAAHCDTEGMGPESRKKIMDHFFSGAQYHDV